ncbi:ABC transporter permease [Varunaivibrio sulfuroxidans]|uniref:Glycine betaine/proline transport system permease protein n=1 Tax=Varunaivibrio sulfuroxidans TaxID=1773489 RepID=A0A4R3JE32_9PROT|nr:proline/glycine betaine ABC transporter permease [Varunaivibrio sulfuroxidans]TCS64122.1 glycine betaine/proline transport system permease protein [Varunaivibrio sulfuroxidans]WES31430.1 proline/glycine betaine ABC transporter permease [Varunaivibrio sulfuroxidans]
MFPENFTFSIRNPINTAIDWLITNFGDTFDAVVHNVLAVFVPIEQALRHTPWWIIVLLVLGLSYHASRNWRLSAMLGALMMLIGVLGLWDMAMQSLALMLVSTVISVTIGIPIGIAMAAHDRLRAAVLPILDMMQTMPSFVYLIPALMLFGLGIVPAILATFIYAVPPVIRLTDLGIRLVDHETVEAARAFGANRRQILFGVQLPLAIPNIMAGVNQTTMMALSMVVIASMIGVRGLGQEVLLGIQRLDVGRGASAGIAIVALAVVLDRITQAYGKRAQAYKQKGHG